MELEQTSEFVLLRKGEREKNLKHEQLFGIY